MVSVSCKNITHIYKNRYVEEKVLDNIDLELETGVLYCLLGPSGSGKTTLLNLIGGLVKPTSGDIFIDGQNIVDFKEEALSDLRINKVGYIFQNYNLIPFLTVKENILLQQRIKREKDSELMNHYESLVKKLGIKDIENKYVDHLSGGQQQRVAIARCLVMKPTIILADEPTGNLDRENSNNFVRLIKELMKTSSVTFVIVTHDERISEYCDKTIKLDNHKLEYL